MNNLLAAIERVSSEEIGEVLKALLARYDELFPDWEINVISIRKSGDRAEQIDRVITSLEHMKKASQ